MLELKDKGHPIRSAHDKGPLRRRRNTLSHNGVRAFSQHTWGSGMGRSRGSCARTTCSLGAVRHSSSLPIRNSSRRSPTSSGGTSTRPETRSSCALKTRSRSSSVGPDGSDVADADRDPAEATHDYVRNGTTTLFAGLEIAAGKVTAALSPGVSGFRQTCCTGVSETGTTSADGQLHSYEDRGPRVVGCEPADPRPFHPDFCVRDH